MKVSIICFGFRASNIRLQPWRYIYEISKGMALKGFDVEIVTDGYPGLPQMEKLDEIVIRHLKQIRTYPFTKNKDLIELIFRRSPDLILLDLGATSFFSIGTFKELKPPIIGLWTGTFYELNEISRLGIGELSRNFRFIYVHLISALIPPSLIKSMLKSSFLKALIVLNMNNRSRIMNYGLKEEKIFVIPPGLTDFDLEIPNAKDIERLKEATGLMEDKFTLLYLGSPLTLRGIDTLINAVSVVRSQIPSLELIILSRKRLEDSNENENYIRQLCSQKKITSCTKIISAFLDKKYVKEFIAISEIVILPFKLVQADTPMAILEVMALGKPLISTRTAGITELLDDGKGLLINPMDSKGLADAILNLYSDSLRRKEIGNKARRYMLKHPTWEQTTLSLIEIFDEILYKNNII